jgi:hypothetical protein
MSAAFVPLVPGVNLAANLATPTRLKPIPATAPAKFEPAIPANHKSEPSAPAAASVPHIQHGPPKITLEREGESITHIRIECSCGQVTELKCEY